MAVCFNKDDKIRFFLPEYYDYVYMYMYVTSPSNKRMLRAPSMVNI